MEEARKLHDTQNQRDRRGIPIDRVGVRQLRYPMQVLDKARSRQQNRLPVEQVADDHRVPVFPREARARHRRNGDDGLPGAIRRHAH